MLHYLSDPIAQAKPSRRTFLKLSVGTAGGLLIGATLPGAMRDAAAAEDLAMPFVHLKADNTITVITKHLDKGQGAATGLATLVAEELDASPDQMAVDFAPANTEVYKNLLFGVQGTGGSTAIANSFDQYRQAGATARAMLVSAAAEAWGVSPEEVTIADGILSAGDTSAPFGEMVAAAAALPVPTEVTLKTPDQWRYIGKDFPRVDVPAKTKGSVGLYGMDVKLDNQLYAVTARPPRFGGTVTSFDAAGALEMAGVVDVLQIPQGIVILAESTYQAMQARDALSIEWDFSAAENRGSEDLLAEYKNLADQPGLSAIDRGDPSGKLAVAANIVEATYSFPYLAHAPMEPLNVTVLFDGEKGTFWTGSQIQTLDQNVGAAVLGIDPANVAINTLWGGGSFGRRAIYDSHYVAEAAAIGRTWFEKTGEARPIKMLYTREDDIKGGYYRPMHVHKVRAGVDENGAISGWEHMIVGQGIMIGTPFEQVL
ncbi:MAG: molybdopterin cofactor-binding domain-containing protein, partial [Pseudomonadota bacterium]